VQVGGVDESAVEVEEDREVSGAGGFHQSGL
jgi:hypothetical protein